MVCFDPIRVYYRHWSLKTHRNRYAKRKALSGLSLFVMFVLNNILVLSSSLSHIMNTIILTEHRKSRQITKKSPLSACDRMAPWNCRVHSALYADQCQRNWMDLKTFIFTSCVTLIPATCFPMGQLRKMYRNC